MIHSRLVISREPHDSRVWWDHNDLHVATAAKEEGDVLKKRVDSYLSEQRGRTYSSTGFARHGNVPAFARAVDDAEGFIADTIRELLERAGPLTEQEVEALWGARLLALSRLPMPWPAKKGR